MKSMEEMIQAAQKAAETIQRQMEDAQGRLDGIEVEGAAGGGLVKIKASAKGRDRRLDRRQPAGSRRQGHPRRPVAAAFNDARTKADAAAGEEMQKVQMAAGIPPGFKLPF
jgi:DNA-binding protein YbaB